MSRTHLLLLALFLPGGTALGQAAPSPETPPASAPTEAPEAEQPAPPEVPPIPKAPPPAPHEEPKREMETLVSGDLTSGGYGGPVLMYSRILGRDALFFGGKGGWLINHHLVLGGGGFSMVTRPPIPEGAPDIGEELRTEFGYGGLWLEYIFLPDRLVHGSFGVLLGGGSVSYSRLRRTQRENREVENDTVITAEPTLAVEMNITPFLRMSVGAGYRYVGNVDLTGMSREDLSGFSGSLMLKFGRF